MPKNCVTFSLLHMVLSHILIKDYELFCCISAEKFDVCFLLGTLLFLDSSGPIELLMTAVCFNEPEPLSDAH